MGLANSQVDEVKVPRRAAGANELDKPQITQMKNISETIKSVDEQLGKSNDQRMPSRVTTLCF
jgi:hypothetical protein